MLLDDACTLINLLGDPGDCSRPHGYHFCGEQSRRRGPSSRPTTMAWALPCSIRLEIQRSLDGVAAATPDEIITRLTNGETFIDNEATFAPSLSPPVPVGVTFTPLTDGIELFGATVVFRSQIERKRREDKLRRLGRRDDRRTRQGGQRKPRKVDLSREHVPRTAHSSQRDHRILRADSGRG